MPVKANFDHKLLAGVLFFVLSLIAWSAQCDVPDEHPSLPFNALLIGWDGVQRDHLKECLSRNELPNLTALAQEGALMAIDVTTGKTDTKAGWTQIVTGYDPEKTGVHSNGDYRPIPRGYTILERVEERYGGEKVVTVFLAGKTHHVGARGPHILIPKRRRAARPNPYETEEEIGKAFQENAGEEISPSSPEIAVGTDVPRRKAGGGRQARPGKQMAGEPYFITKDHIDLFENGLGEPDQVGARALECLNRYSGQPFFFFVHFLEPDHAGHKNGENSQEYTNGIMEDDRWLGILVAELKKLGLYDKTRIYVACDHGFDEGESSHKDAPYVFFATNDPKVAKRGDRKDITPTILWRLGFDLETIEPPLDGTPLKRGETEQEIW